MPELRRDPITGRWIIISTDRGKRPSDFSRGVENTAGNKCPFCLGNEAMTPSEIVGYGDSGRSRNAANWRVRVIPNKFPALAIEGTLNRQGDGMYDRMNGLGAHEIIIESPHHDRDIFDLSDKDVENILWAYRDRILDLKKDIRLEYILIFKNHGSAAGATLAHPHSQLIATPVVPKRVREEVNGGKIYFDYKERCGFCDIIKQELSFGQRVVAENDDFVALCPFASRFPFEVWVLPKNHSSDFNEIEEHQVVNLAVMMKSVVGKLMRTLDNPSYNYLIHTAPLKESHLPHYHWHIEIIPKLTRVAGFEWGSGFYINPTAPEEAAQFLRDVE
ncbi:MAG: galactose-1-phosphate uridylyltransferase [Elusimicrobia bacterium]|nr:galactose-1-phosphate uridylyltransferase [Elusimicrobiota bacterium]